MGDDLLDEPADVHDAYLAEPFVTGGQKLVGWLDRVNRAIPLATTLAVTGTIVLGVNAAVTGASLPDLADVLWKLYAGLGVLGWARNGAGHGVGKV